MLIDAEDCGRVGETFMEQRERPVANIQDLSQNLEVNVKASAYSNLPEATKWLRILTSSRKKTIASFSQRTSVPLPGSQNQLCLSVLIPLVVCDPGFWSG